MAGYTNNLNLYFKDPVADGAEKFNIATMMNENWEKLDGMFDLEVSGTGTIPGYLDVLSTSYDWRLAYGNGVWVGVSPSSDAAIWSDDGGQTWNETTMPKSAPWQDVIYGGGKFVACNTGGETVRVAFSEDGKNWEGCYGTGSTLVAGSAVCYADGRYVVMGTNGGVIYTEDLKGDWTFQGTVFPTYENKRMAYGKGMLVGVSESGDKAVYSRNGGLSWSDTNTWITGSGLVDVAFGNGIFVCVASGASKFARSDDGMSWLTGDMPATANNGWSFVTYGMGRFLAGNYVDQVLAISKDGTTWETIQSPVSGAWKNCAYGEGRFLLCQTDDATTLLAGSVLYDKIIELAKQDILALMGYLGLQNGDEVMEATNGVVTASTIIGDGNAYTEIAIPTGRRAKGLIYFHTAGNGIIFLGQHASSFTIYKNGSTFAISNDSIQPITGTNGKVYIEWAGSASVARFNASGARYVAIAFS